MTDEARLKGVVAVAYDALNHSKQNQRDIEAHEDLCAERYKNIHEAIAELKGTMKWGGGLALSITLSMLGFLAVQQFSANDRAQRDQQTKIEVLQRELIEARGARR